jgi:hypothetical protein
LPSSDRGFAVLFFRQPFMPIFLSAGESRIWQ